MTSLLVDGSCRQSDPTTYPVQRKDEPKRKKTYRKKIGDLGLLCHNLQILKQSLYGAMTDAIDRSGAEHYEILTH
jgi:hypothetical protein